MGGMSFSGTDRSRKRKKALGASSQGKPIRAHLTGRFGIQILEITALIVFFVGIGADNIIIMLLSPVIGWGAVALAYRAFQKDLNKHDPDRLIDLSMPKIVMYIAFTLATALSLMAVLTILI